MHWQHKVHALGVLQGVVHPEDPHIQGKQNHLLPVLLPLCRFHNIRCDLCKETMPFSVAKNGTSYPILDYKKDYEVNDSHSYSMDAFREDEDLFNQPIYDMR